MSGLKPKTSQKDVHKIKRIIQDPITLSMQKKKEQKPMLRPIAEQNDNKKISKQNS